MNHFQQIKAFRLLQRTKQELQSPAVALWYALLGTSNDLGHPAAFAVALSTLALDAGLSVSGVKRARNTLAQKGYIQWRERRGRACAEYTLLDITLDYFGGAMAPREPQGEPRGEPDAAPDSGPIHYQKRKTGPKQDKPPLAPQGEGEGEGFDAFWEIYPKKAGKEAARKAYARLAPEGELRERMRLAVRAQSQGEQWPRDGGRFIPLPANWLSQRRWEDEAGGGGNGNGNGAAGGLGRAGGRVSEQMYPQRDYDPAEVDGPSPEAIREAMKY
jgi:hypothetical protein